MNIYKENRKISTCIQKIIDFWKTSKHRGCFECKRLKLKLKKKLQELFRHLTLILKQEKLHKNLTLRKQSMFTTTGSRNTSSKQDKQTSTKQKKNGTSYPNSKEEIYKYSHALVERHYAFRTEMLNICFKKGMRNKVKIEKIKDLL